MERVSDLSKLTIPKQTKAVEVKQTVVAFRNHHCIEVPCVSSIETAMLSRVFSFTTPPCIASELDLSECYLNVTVGIKKNGNAYAKTDQISCIQALPLLMWE